MALAFSPRGKKGAAMSSRKGTMSVFLALVASLGLNVYLGLALARREPPRLPQGGIKTGQDLGSLTVTDSSGGKGRLFSDGEESRPAILYVFSPACAWCARDHRNIVELSRKLAGQYRFVALALHPEGLEQYLDEYPMPFEVRLLAGRPTVALGLEVTPQTVVVDRMGKATQVWVGAALPRVKDQMERFFSVSLPGALVE